MSISNDTDDDHDDDEREKKMKCYVLSNGISEEILKLQFVCFSVLKCK